MGSLRRFCFSGQLASAKTGAVQFAGSLLADKRASVIVSLSQSVRFTGRDPYAYLEDVLKRLPTQPPNRVGELLTHLWMTAS